MSTVLGTKAATLQPIKFGWSQERGFHTTKEWHGGESQIRALINQIVFDGGAYEVEQMTGDMWKITASYSAAQPDGSGGGDTGGQEIAVTWELLPKDAQKELLASHHPLVSGLSQYWIDQVRTDAEDPKCGAVTAPTVSDGEGRVTALTGDALKVLKLLKSGVDTVEIEQPVLNLTWIVPNNVNLSYSYANIGRIYTTSSLISTEQIPSYISTSMVAWTASFTNPTYGANRVSLVFGWKKRAPTQRLAGLNRREINQTWEFGLWATDIYGLTV